MSTLCSYIDVLLGMDFLFFWQSAVLSSLPLALIQWERCHFMNHLISLGKLGLEPIQIDSSKMSKFGFGFDLPPSDLHLLVHPFLTK